MPLPQFQANAINAANDMVIRVVVMSPRVVSMVIERASMAKTTRGRFSARKQMTEMMKPTSSRVLRELLMTMRDDEIAHHTMFQMVLRTYASM